MKTQILGTVPSLFDTVMMMEPLALRRLAASYARIAVMNEDSRKAMAAYSDSESADKPVYVVSGGIATLPIKGVLLPQANFWYDWLGIPYASYDRLCAACNQLENDSTVKGVELDVDSPGGHVTGCFETTNAMASLAKKKPVVAYIQQCCSAALSITSQAGQIVGNEDCMIGSCGAYMPLEDSSAMYEQMGIKVHIIGTSILKGAGEDGTVITDEQLAAFTELIEARAQPMFTQVQAGRSLSDKQMAVVKSAKVWVGAGGKSVGLLDKVGDRATGRKLLENTKWHDKKKTTSAQFCADTENTEMSTEIEQRRNVFAEFFGFGKDAPAATATVVAPAAAPAVAVGPSARELALEAELLASKKEANAKVIDGYASTGKFLAAHKDDHEQIRFACATAGIADVYDRAFAGLAKQPMLATDTDAVANTGAVVDADLLGNKINVTVAATTDKQVVDDSYELGKALALAMNKKAAK